MNMEQQFSHSTGTTSITNGRIVTPERLIEAGGIRVERGIITDIWEHGRGLCGDDVIDAGGCLVLPGFVDIHADALEMAIAPRPSTPFPAATILPSYDTFLAMHGFTTVFHCVGLAEIGEATKQLRTRRSASEIIDTIRRFSPLSQVRSRIHLRYEITDVASLPLVYHLVDQGQVDLISIMDHTPGFGVFKDIEAYRTYYLRSGMTTAAADARFAELLELHEQVDMAALQRLVSRCLAGGLTVVSHDDHSREKIQWALDLGVTVAEFPVTLEAVDFARSHGMWTVFGTPNLVRGMSHAGNLLVSDMLASGRTDILCLDYAPLCSLLAFFKAAELTGASLPEISRLFSLNPARAVGLASVTGSLERGKSGDLILVDTHQTIPRVLATFVQGKPVYQTIPSGDRQVQISN